MKKKLLLMVMVLALAVSFGACGKKDVKKAKKPDDIATQITKANFDSLNFKNMGLEVKVGVTSDIKPYLEKMFTNPEQKKYIGFINDMAKNSSIGYKFLTKYDDKNKVPMFDIAYSVYTKDKPLIGLSAFYDGKNIGIMMPEVSKKGIIMDPVQILKNSPEISKKDFEYVSKLLKLDFDKYVKIFTEGKSLYEIYAKNYTDYKKIYDDYLNKNFKKTETKSIKRNGKDIAVTEYKASVDFKTAMDLNKKFLEIAKKDDKLRERLVKKLGLVIDELIKSKDYEVLEIKVADLEKAKKELEKLNNAENAKKWAEGIEKAIKNNDDSIKKLPEFAKNFKMDVVLRINSEGKMDSGVILYTLNVDKNMPPVTLKAEVMYIQNPKLTKSDSKNFFDFTPYVELSEKKTEEMLKKDKKFGSFAKGFIKDFISYATDSENVKGVYELMKKNKLEMEESMIKLVLTQMKESVDKMTVEQLMQGMQGAKR